MADITDSHELSCSGCRVDMVSPIYVCENNHDFCEDCKYTTVCKLCNKRITSRRNLALEEVTYGVLYPCRWSNRCILHNHRTIRAHEAACTYRLYKCPAQFCNFHRYFIEIPVHIDIKHSTIDFNVFHTYVNEQKQDHAWFMMAYYELFDCKFTLDRYTAEWRMHLLAPFARAKELQVHLTIGDRKYPLKLGNYFGPKFSIQLAYEELPDVNDFRYVLKVSRSDPYIV